MLLQDEAFTFHYVRGRDLRIGNEVHLLHATRDAIREIPVSGLRCDWSRSKLGLNYPDEVVMDDVLRLTHPRVGLIELDCQILTAENQTELLVVFTAAPGTEDAEKLALLRVIGTQSFAS